MTKTRKADVDSSQDVRSGGVRVELSLQLLDANEPKYKKEKLKTLNRKQKKTEKSNFMTACRPDFFFSVFPLASEHIKKTFLGS